MARPRSLPRTSCSLRTAAVPVLVVLALMAPTSSALDAGSPAVAAGRVTAWARVAGADRVATAVAVSQDRWALATAPAGGAVLASADDFADALAGAALADHVGGPLLLTGARQLDRRTADELAVRLAPGATVHLLGGGAALSTEVESAVAALGLRVQRLQGPDRYGTAAAVVETIGAGDPSGAAADGARCDLLLATGTGFADGAAASGAASERRPLLFSAGSSLPAATGEAVTRCAAAAGGRGSITAVGGGAAAALAALPAAAGSLATTAVVGSDRYETSARLMSHLLTGSSSDDPSGTVVLTSGLDYPDALVGGTYGAPVLLTRPDALPAPVAQQLREHRDATTRLLVVGGTRSVADVTAQHARDVVDSTVQVTDDGGGGGGPGGVPNRSGGRWNSGVYYPGPSRTKLADHQAFADWRGRPLDVSVDWQARSTWSDITDSAWLYRTWAGTPQTKVFGVAMLPEDEPGVSLAACAAGDYDGRWAEFGSSITRHGLADEVVVRLGWEFNGDWYRWSAHDPAVFAECWRRVVTAARTTAPALRWSWDVNRGPGHSVRDAREAWPGDAYVDIVGVDSYDGYPAVTDEASWRVQHSGAYGLRFWADFAAQHGKALAVPEWGVYPGTARAGVSGGDNAYYVEKMAGFFAEVSDRLAYEAYFNQSRASYAGAIYGPSLNPRAAAAYQQHW